jgi:hypothetical protein
MNPQLIRVGIPSAIAGIAILAALSGCAPTSPQPTGGTATVDASPTTDASVGSPTPPPGQASGGTDGSGGGSGGSGGGSGGSGGGGGSGGSSGGGGSQWPSPENCINYEPSTAQIAPNNYGGYSVWAGGQELVRLYDNGDDNAQAKVLALVNRYRTVCFVGRGNDRLEFVFEYWKNPSGNNSPIPGSEDDCSTYDRTRLQVDDTGDGWRVKNDDNVLQLFATQHEAENGRIVLAKYDRICRIHTESFDEEDRAQITYA